MFSIARFTILRFFEPAFIFLYMFGFLVSYLGIGGRSIDFSAFLNIAGENSQINLASFILFALALIICIFIGATDIPRDINSRMITIYLSKPITRDHYVIGKFIGAYTLVGGFFISWILLLNGIDYVNRPELNYRIRIRSSA